MPGEDKLHSTVRVRARFAHPYGVATLGLAALALTACQKPAGLGAQADKAANPSGYLSPPTVMAAARDASGGVTLSGQAPGQTEVRLRDPGGGAFSATAGDDGDWSIQLPPADAPRMFAFEGDVSGRLIHGEGALLILPTPAPVAVLARAGYGALPIGAGPGPLSIAAIDYDGAGGGSVSGVTAPNAPVRFVLDGQPVGLSQADAEGRFSVLDLNIRKPFGLGQHTVRIEGPSGAVEGRVSVTPAKALGDAAFRTAREGPAWRADWRTPGGGLQTLLVFGAAPAPAPGGVKS